MRTLDASFPARVEVFGCELIVFGFDRIVFKRRERLLEILVMCKSRFPVSSNSNYTDAMQSMNFRNAVGRAWVSVNSSGLTKRRPPCFAVAVVPAPPASSTSTT